MPKAEPKDLAETYVNHLYDNPGNNTCHRYWVGRWPVLVGGSIRDSEDFRSLERRFGITHVINVETEHDDAGKVPSGRLLQVRVPDVGTPFPPEAVLSACLFAANALRTAASRLYVHCQQGGSRSPAFAYAILRGVFLQTPEDALSQIVDARSGDYNVHEFHRVYMGSVDRALSGIC